MTSVGRFLLALFLLIAVTPASASVGATPGEFSVSPTGGATYSIPIAVPPGTAGMEPKLMLGYSSQSGNGIAGTGWSISGLSAISRCPSTLAQDGINRGVQYDANDKLCLDGQRLIAVNGAYSADGTEYRTEIESFTRVISHGATATGPQWFEAWTKSGQHIEYGNAATSVTSNVTVAPLTPGGVTPTIVWAVSKISDTVGNYLSFTYLDDPANGQFYPQEIDYTGNAAANLRPYNKVTFSYAARASSPPAVYLNGYKSQLTQRLTTITTYAGATQARTYNLGYSASGDFMSSMQECDGAGNCVNPTSFGWQLPGGSGDFEATQPTLSGTDFTTAWFASSGDVNGDGYDDLLTVVNGGDGQSHLLLRTATGDANVFKAPVDVGITTPLRNCAIAANCAENQEWTGLPAAPEVSVLGDVNGDGYADLILGDGRVALGSANGAFGTPYAANVQIGAAPFASAKDVNGDGLADLVYGIAQADSLTHYYIQYAQANGSFANPVQIATEPLVPLYVGSGTYASSTISEPCAATLGDVNGDGRADLITCAGHVYSAIDNNGFSNAVAWGAVDNPGHGYQQAPGNPPIPGFMAAGDINGDGLSDVFSGTFYWQLISVLSSDTVKSDGHAFGTPTEQTWTYGAYFTSSSCFPVPYSGLVAGDFTGRGRADALEFNYSGLSSCPSQPNATATLLRALVTNPPAITTITDGLGASRSIAYAQLNDNTVYTASTGSAYPMRDLPPTASSLYLVSSTSADNGIGGQFVLNYQYAGGKADAHGRGFLGFRTITVTDPQSGIVTATAYAQAFPYIGQMQSQTKTVVNGATPVTLSNVINTMASLRIPAAPPANGSMPSTTCPGSVCVTYPYVATSLSYSTDLNGTALPYAAVLNYNLDWYGNIGTHYVYNSDGYSKTTTSTYTNDATHWLLGRLTQSQVASSISSGASTWTQTRTSAFQYDPASGLLTKEIIEPGNSTLELDTSYGYDSFGNRKTVTVSSPVTGATAIASRTTTTVYDAKGQFPVTVTNALNQSETRAYDPRFGTMTSLKGPNGLTTTWQYDGFGRKVSESRADGSATTISYVACTSGACTLNTSTGQNLSTTLSTTAATAAYAVLTQNTITNGTVAVSPPTATLYDKLKRPIRSVIRSFDNTTNIWQDTQYNANGWVAQTSLPYFPTGTAYWTQTQYDLLGRPTTVTRPDTSTTMFGYNGLSTTTTENVIHSSTANPTTLAQTTTKVKNSQGQIVSVTDAAGKTTTYGYDPFGNRTSVTDPNGNTNAVIYNIRGFRTLVLDHDTNAISFNPNPLGQMVSTTDAKNQTTTYLYDPLGRMTQRTASDQTSYWVYDTMPMGVGKLAYSYVTGTASGNNHIYNYDSLSRPSVSYLLAPKGTLQATVTYDGAGRVLTRQYPDGFTLKNVYNYQGQLSQVIRTDTNTPIWTANSVDALGRVTQETFGNGVVTNHGFDPATGRQLTITAGAANGVMNQTYTYDSIGNVQTRVDPLAGTSEAFQYDILNRLTQDATLLTNGCASNCLSSVTVAYDALGNITAKSDVGAYAYSGYGPHAVSSAGSLTFAYDNVGNLTSGAGRTYTWNAANLMASVTSAIGTTSWAYDADYNRVTQTEGSETTTFLNPRIDLGMHYEEIDYSGGRQDLTHILYAGNEVIGQYITTNQTGVAPRTRYFNTDPLGSIIALTDETGTVTDRYAYDPWGKRTVVTGAAADSDHGFTGHEHLDNGLIQMNGRLYLPGLARFASADPVIQAPYNLQSYNGYSYVLNNPMCGIDPSGLSFFSSIAREWHKFYNSQAGRIITSIAVSYLTWGSLNGLFIPGGDLTAAAISGAAGGYAATGTTQGTLHGALTAGAFNVAGDIEFAQGWNPGGPGSVFTHAIVGGATNEAAGGSFKAGFLSGGFSEAAVPYVNTGNPFAGAVESAVVGGTASVLGGGKFANGAETGAFGYLFNFLAHKRPVINPNGIGEDSSYAIDFEENVPSKELGWAGRLLSWIGYDGLGLPLNILAKGQDWTQDAICIAQACYGSRDLSEDIRTQARGIEPQVRTMAIGIASSNGWDLNYLSRTQLQTIVRDWAKIPNFTKIYGSTDSIMSHFTTR